MSNPASPSAVNRAIAVCGCHQAADSTIRALSRAGFDMDTLSIVGKRYRAVAGGAQPAPAAFAPYAAGVGQGGAGAAGATRTGGPVRREWPTHR